MPQSTADIALSAWLEIAGFSRLHADAGGFKDIAPMASMLAPFGHLGDGNLHYNMCYRAKSPVILLTSSKPYSGYCL